MASVAKRYAARLLRLFEDADLAVAINLRDAKLEAGHHGGLSNSRFAFVALDAIERGLRPAIEEGLVSYDLAANRPFPPRRRLQQELKARIEGSFERAIASLERGKGAFSDPWREPLATNAPALRQKLVGLVDQHATGLAPTGVRDLKPWWERGLISRIALLVAAAAFGAIAKTIIDGAFGTGA